MSGTFFWDKAFKPIIGLSVLIVSLSIAYYFVVFLPSREQQKLEMIKEEREAKSLEDSGRIISLEYCIQDADTFYLQSWNQMCAGLKKGEKCSLPDKETNRVMDLYSEKKDECYRKYGK